MSFLTCGSEGIDQYRKIFFKGTISCSRELAALCSSRSKDSGDISATYRVNEDDNDE